MTSDYLKNEMKFLNLETKIRSIIMFPHINYN